MKPRVKLAAGVVAGVIVAALGIAAATRVFSGGGGEAGGDVGAADPDRVRVEVLNAAGRTGLAREATRRLRSRGFDVVYFGNAGEFGRDSSIVLDRVGDERTARRVAGALGIRNVASEPDSSLLLDVSVILGMDWPPAERAPAQGLGARIRSWLQRARGASEN